MKQVITGKRKTNLQYSSPYVGGVVKPRPNKYDTTTPIGINTPFTEPNNPDIYTGLNSLTYNGTKLEFMPTANPTNSL